MSEDTDLKLLESAKDDVALLEYDYLKHLSTLSLVTLGGVLTLTQDKATISSGNVILVVVMIALAGTSALAGIDMIISAKSKGKALGWTYRFTRLLAMAAFGLGVGVFLNMFLDIIKT